MFKCKNLLALCCFWAITMTATVSMAAICFAPSGGCLEGGIKVDDGDTDTFREPGSINNCPGYDLYEKLEGKGFEDDNGNSLCSSCVQNNRTLWRCPPHQCAGKFNLVNKKGTAEEGWDCEDCYSGYDVKYFCEPHQCAPEYKETKNEYHRDCSDTCMSAGKKLYNCVCDEEHPLEVNGKCIKECTGYAEEYVEASDSCECQTGYTSRNGICSREDVSLSCEELLDKFSRVQYTKMSNSDCERDKQALGITKCIGQDDYWAGAVKACGGFANMPTGDELYELAKCMYGLSVADSSMYGIRKDSYLEELGLNTGDHVFVWTNYQSTNNNRGVVRMFAKNGSIPYWAERNGANYYTGNGTSASSWENTSILSETLCHRTKAEGTCADLAARFETKSYSPINQSTCNSEKGGLGITNCPVATDYWAGAVKTCGGINKIASEDDLFNLAKCAYGKTQASSSMYGTRNNSYMQSLGLDTASHVYVWSAYQNNKSDHNAIVRMFASDGSIPYWAERDGSKYYEGNGAFPTDWKSDSIKSKVLCRKPTETDNCGSDYNLSTRPVLGKYLTCGNKYKCDGGTFLDLASPTCFNGCDTLNYSNGVYTGTSTSKYVTSASQCPTGTTAYPTGKLFTESMFASTPMHNMECYHCEAEGVQIYYSVTDSTCAPYLYITQGDGSPINFGTSSIQKKVSAGTYTVGFGLSKGYPTTIKIEGGSASPVTFDAVVPSGASSKILGDYNFAYKEGITYRITPTCETSTESCPSGYDKVAKTTDAETAYIENECGRSGTDGWELEYNGEANGKNCVKCKAKQCPQGSCTGVTDTNAPIGGYSGDDVCRQHQSCDDDDDDDNGGDCGTCDCPPPGNGRECGWDGSVGNDNCGRCDCWICHN